MSFVRETIITNNAQSIYFGFRNGLPFAPSVIFIWKASDKWQVLPPLASYCTNGWYPWVCGSFWVESVANGVFGRRSASGSSIERYICGCGVSDSKDILEVVQARPAACRVNSWVSDDGAAAALFADLMADAGVATLTPAESYLS